MKFYDVHSIAAVHPYMNELNRRVPNCLVKDAEREE